MINFSCIIILTYTKGFFIHKKNIINIKIITEEIIPMTTTLTNNVFQMQELVTPLYIATIAILFLIPITFFVTCSWLKKKTQIKFPKIKSLISILEFIIVFIVFAFLYCSSQNYDPSFECLSANIAETIVWNSPFMTIVKILILIPIVYFLSPGMNKKKR